METTFTSTTFVLARQCTGYDIYIYIYSVGSISRIYIYICIYIYISLSLSLYIYIYIYIPSDIPRGYTYIYIYIDILSDVYFVGSIWGQEGPRPHGSFGGVKENNTYLMPSKLPWVWDLPMLLFQITLYATITYTPPPINVCSV